MHACVLLSGGIDSATCLALLLQRRAQTEALFVDYGQAALRFESGAARRVADHYGVTLHTVRIDFGRTWGAGEITGRNAALLTLALMSFPHDSGCIALGLHDHTGYADCSRDFLVRIQSVMDLYSLGRITVVAPFISWAKADIVQAARQQGVPLDLTYSCEAGTDIDGCGCCRSCLDRDDHNVR